MDRIKMISKEKKENSDYTARIETRWHNITRKKNNILSRSSISVK